MEKCPIPSQIVPRGQTHPQKKRPNRRVRINNIPAGTKKVRDNNEPAKLINPINGSMRKKMFTGMKLFKGKDAL